MTLTAKTDSKVAPDAIAAMHAQFSPTALWQRKVRRSVRGAIWRSALSVSRWGKRFTDVLLAGLALLSLLPLLVVVALVIGLDGRPVFTFEPRVGRWCVPFSIVAFNTNRRGGSVLRWFGLYRIPVLINVFRGEMSIIGPRAMRPEELDARARSARKRSDVRPGLISLWWLRKKANIHFGSELDVDLEYVDHQTVSGDLGIVLRSVASVLYGASPTTAPAQIDILGVLVDNLTMDEALQYILGTASGPTPRQLCFVNTDCINKSIHDRKYKAALGRADRILADGIGIRLAGKIMGREVRQNVNGTDLFPLLCERLQDSELGLFLLGARPETVCAFADWVKKTYPNLRLKGYRNGYFDASEEENVIQEIRDSGAEILLVAFGSPRQDLWISKHLLALGKVRIAMGVGGLFDFYSGRIPRAPRWMRELSLEWTYRLYQEPRRMWRRYLIGNFVFLSRVVRSAIVRRSEKETAANY